jgi:hypothetical protein
MSITEQLRSERPGSNGELERLKPLARAPVVKESKGDISWKRRDIVEGCRVWLETASGR